MIEVKNNKGFTPITLVILLVAGTVAAGSYLVTRSTKPIPTEPYETISTGNLTILIPDQAFSHEVNVQLNPSGYLEDRNKFSDVENFNLVITPKDITIPNTEIKILKPLKLSYSLLDPQIKNKIRLCEYDVKSLGFYMEKPTYNNSGETPKEITKLPTVLDKETQTATSTLLELSRYREDGILTYITIGANPTKYLGECGNITEATIENKILTYNKWHYSIEIPETEGRPVLENSYVSDALLFVHPDKAQSFFYIVSAENPQYLKTRKLLEYKFPGYAGIDQPTIAARETVETARILVIRDREFMEVISRNQENKIYRLMTSYSKEKYVWLAHVTLNREQEEYLDSYKEIIREIARTFTELEK